MDNTYWLLQISTVLQVSGHRTYRTSDTIFVNPFCRLTVNKRPHYVPSKLSKLIQREFWFLSVFLMSYLEFEGLPSFLLSQVNSHTACSIKSCGQKMTLNLSLSNLWFHSSYRLKWYDTQSLITLKWMDQNYKKFVQMNWNLIWHKQYLQTKIKFGYSKFDVNYLLVSIEIEHFLFVAILSLILVLLSFQFHSKFQQNKFQNHLLSIVGSLIIPVDVNKLTQNMSYFLIFSDYSNWCRCNCSKNVYFQSWKTLGGWVGEPT